ncbi:MULTISPECIES: hypothetical protein [unclassified Vibrio]|uniref:hypothetical protein n=1 Tax=unclassified Vibrio TaxID=2614977 RepID=UPI001372A9E0|nr:MULTISPECIES: hypothetical protein [unclassified Vibrio]NAW96867.1 hypothetical protein [Vibrio sp. V23_P3S9T160]NAX17098.1 hypothetical protein [Vibrio sp. V22_P2S10T140]
MKHNLFTITALTAAMLAGFAHADVPVGEGAGSKIYTFDIGKTIDETLSVDFVFNGQTVKPDQQYEYVLSSPGATIVSGYHPAGRTMYAGIMQNHELSSNSTANSFTLTFKNTQPMTFDDGNTTVNCLDAGATSCGTVHHAWVHGRNNPNDIGSGSDVVIKDFRAGEKLKGFYVTHWTPDSTWNFPSGVYSEQWQLTVTPEI